MVTDNDYGVIARSYSLGYKKVASINGNTVPITSGGWNEQNNISTTNYAATPFSGSKLREVHARGTKEISFNIGGDITEEEGEVIFHMLQEYHRGVIYGINLQQDNLTSCFLQRCVTASISITGSADGLVSWTAEGKCLDAPISSNAPLSYNWCPRYVPGWSSGGADLATWTLTHSIGLSPVWFNNQNPIPAYYRPDTSEFRLAVTSVGNLRISSGISIGVGEISLFNGVVTSKRYSVGGSRSDFETYDVEVTNFFIHGKD